MSDDEGGDYVHYGENEEDMSSGLEEKVHAKLVSILTWISEMLEQHPANTCKTIPRWSIIAMILLHNFELTKFLAMYWHPHPICIRVYKFTIDIVKEFPALDTGNLIDSTFENE
jgi:hypothetical protein